MGYGWCAVCVLYPPSLRRRRTSALLDSYRGTPKEDSRIAVRNSLFEGRDDTTREGVRVVFGDLGAAGGDPKVPLGVVTQKFQLHSKSPAVARNP